ncbi:AraC family transcriptional regulator [Bacillaceae bacterium SIJ1]|uniref:AraC family transcriptional regulator n=1 Tax=Litoribacterium kuwaitense TaxID=1398745 RepID=UPI0013EB2AA2|nr:AraC family transcriptional regulator [Litoribacterium kuwaitense]NGP45543.1 AraC family transcriptional regulator [Litoribacterium kuwaitense]
MEKGDLYPVFAAKECYAGSIVNIPGCIYGPRHQSELQILLLHSGSMLTTIGHKQIDLKPGQMMLLLPDQQVHIAFSSQEETWHRWITVFEYDIDVKILEMMHQLPQHRLISEQMNRLLDALVGIQRQNIPGSSAVLNTLALSVFQQYAIECKNDVKELTVHPAVTLVQTLIQERYHEELTLSLLASKGCISVSYLVRLFRQNTRMTPMQYIWKYRMERGVELLRTTGLTVKEIADRCGFKSPYHFSRIVKTNKGLTPTDIQKGKLK